MMKSLLPLIFAAALFAAGVVSESHGSELLRVDGDGWYSWQIAEDEELEIYVRMESGRPQDIRIPGWQCERNTPPVAEKLGTISAAESAAWLGRFISPRSDVSTEAMAAISAHPGGEGTRILRNVVQSDGNRKNREEAIFWLAQSEDDAAFAFLDALLTRAD